MDNVILTTGTLYNLNVESEKIRFELAKKTIRLAKDSGYEILVLDIGSSEEVISGLKEAGGIVSVITEKTMGEGRRASIKNAFDSGKDIIMWLEPEKTDFIKDIPKVVEPLLSNTADIVIPRRQSLHSYPSSQQYSEQFGNSVVTTITGLDSDMFFGPRAFKRDIAEYCTSYDGKYGDIWEALMIPIIAAHKDGKKIVSVDVDYTHPKEQSDFEEGNVEFDMKRLKQLDNILPAVHDFWTKNL